MRTSFFGIISVLTVFMFSFLAPSALYAQVDVGGELRAFGDTLNAILDILNNAVIPIIIALAIIYFLWGVVQYVIAKGPEDKEQAKNTMIYGLIGLFVIFAVWGLLALIGNLLIGQEPGQGTVPTFDAPDVDGSGGGSGGYTPGA